MPEQENHRRGASEEKLSDKIDQVEQGYSIEAQGLKLLRDLTVAEWEDLGRSIIAKMDTAQWAMGDWLSYGEIRGIRGQTYERALELTGLSQSTLMNYVMVARAYSHHKRVRGASWSRHLEALRLPEDDRIKLIKKSVSESWSTKLWVATLKRLTEEHVAKLQPEGRPGEQARGPAVKGYRSRRKVPNTVMGIKCPFCDNIIPKAKLHLYNTADKKEKS